jgi:hypothetical protein
MAQVVRVRHNGAVVPITALTLDETLCGGEEIYRSPVALPPYCHMRPVATRPPERTYLPAASQANCVAAGSSRRSHEDCAQGPPAGARCDTAVRLTNLCSDLSRHSLMGRPPVAVFREHQPRTTRRSQGYSAGAGLEVCCHASTSRRKALGVLGCCSDVRGQSGASLAERAQRCGVGALQELPSCNLVRCARVPAYFHAWYIRTPPAPLALTSALV